MGFACRPTPSIRTMVRPWLTGMVPTPWVSFSFAWLSARFLDPWGKKVASSLTSSISSMKLSWKWFTVLCGTYFGTVYHFIWYNFRSSGFHFQKHWISRISPLGISSVICAKILSVPNLGLVMSQLAMFIITVVFGIFLYQFTVLQLIYLAIVRKNPFKFWWGMFQSWMTAFATAST